ncbi:hypothetical protein Q5735_16020, partial [Lactiplantibacillus plantarum]|nr:hypothetical protein [Lactiplantibacillus plantarum]
LVCFISVPFLGVFTKIIVYTICFLNIIFVYLLIFNFWKNQGFNFMGVFFMNGGVLAVFPVTTRSAFVVVRGIYRQRCRSKLYYVQLTKT